MSTFDEMSSNEQNEILASSYLHRAGMVQKIQEVQRVVEGIKFHYERLIHVLMLMNPESTALPLEEAVTRRQLESIERLLKEIKVPPAL